jgi:CDP-diacylglycerol pyrophosphatase
MKKTCILLSLISILFTFVVFGNEHENVPVFLDSSYVCAAGQESQDSHFYSPAQFNADDQVSDQCQPCSLLENASHNSCKVGQFIRSAACAGSFCKDAQGAFLMRHEADKRFALQHDLRFLDEDKYLRAKDENCRFIFWALDPEIGIEDFRQHKKSDYWSQAFEASQHLVSPAFPLEDLALGIQPATKRGQHQLHIHIGTLANGYREVVDSLSLNSENTQQILINRNEFFVRYVPGIEGKNPFSGRNIFEVMGEIIPGGESSMPRYGMLVAIAKNQKGIFILAAKNWERSEMNYKQSHVCEFAKK